LASTESKTDSGAIRLLLFSVGESIFGCDIGSVREIVPARHATRLPGTPDYVRGLINLRGAIVTVVDLARRLGGGSAAADGSIILVEHGTKVVGLAVDDVRDVMPMSESQLEAATGDLARGGLVRSVGHVEGGVVLVLDVLGLVRQVMA
jgi:purine-binding chemotaxis protein CheW